MAPGFNFLQRVKNLNKIGLRLLSSVQLELAGSKKKVGVDKKVQNSEKVQHFLGSYGSRVANEEWNNTSWI